MKPLKHPAGRAITCDWSTKSLIVVVYEKIIKLFTDQSKVSALATGGKTNRLKNI